MKKLCILSVASIATLSMILTMTGCGSKYTAANDMSYGIVGKNVSFDGTALADDYGYADYAAEEYIETEAYDESNSVTSQSGGVNVAENRKLIKTVDITVETEEFDTYIKLLYEEVNSIGGYIESEYTYNGSALYGNNDDKYANIRVRVPASKLDEFVSATSNAGNITDKRTTTEDATLNYVDMESRKEMYLAEQESLLALLEKAESVEDIVYLTERLSDVRYNIESLESSLRTCDNLVDYATVNLNIQQVTVYTPTVEAPQTLGERISQGFKQSVNDVFTGIQNSFVRFVVRSPYLIKFLVKFAIFAGIVYGIVRIIIAIVKKKRNKKAANKASLAEAKEVTDADETKKEEKV